MRDDNIRFYPSRDPGEGLRQDQRDFLEAATTSLGESSLFYASLRHPRVFKSVVGRSLNDCEWELVSVPGFRLGAVNAGTGFPGIFPAADAARLSGLVVHDLSAFEQAMVAWYEWDEYLLESVPLSDRRRVQAFVPDLEAIRAEHGPCAIVDWSFENWQAACLDRAVAVAREWMAQRPSDDDLRDSGFFTAGGRSAVHRAAG